MSIVKQRKHDREFKINAIIFYRESGKWVEAMAMKLGISKPTLYAWVKEFKEHEEDSFPGSRPLKLCNEEVYRLEKQL